MKISELLEKSADLISLDSGEESTKLQWLQPFLQNFCGWDTTATRGKYKIGWEARNIAGRVDLALKIDKRVAVCIELKRPRLHLEGKELEIALKYGNSYYYPKNGYIDPVLTVLTNSQEAVLIDCSRRNPLDSYNLLRIDLRTKQGLEQLASYLRPDAIDLPDSKLPFVTAKREADTDPFASAAPELFLQKVTDFIQRLEEKGYTKKRAIEISIYCVLLAAARDNNIIPNADILRYLERKDTVSLKKHIQRLFGDVFLDIDGEETKDFWPLYQDTRVFPLRLDIVPVEFIGLLYQKLLSIYSQNTTSFYTPNDMVEKIISYVNPTIEDKGILDPTCGSGVFLAAATIHAINQKVEKDGSVSNEEMQNFISNLYGVDKDPLACKIAKVTLITTFMRHVDDSYHRSGVSLPTPKIVENNFFNFINRNKFDVIIGNPPWQLLDKCSDEKPIIIQNKDDWAVYNAKNDILCYVVEKCVKRHLNEKGRFGFVIKRQTLFGSTYFDFVKYLDQKIELIYDYGQEKKFLDDPAESLIICGKKSVNNSWSIHRGQYRQDICKQTGNIKPFNSCFSSTRGAESACDHVYRKYAEDFPDENCVRNTVSGFTLGGKPETTSKIAYFFSDHVPDDFAKWSKKTLVEYKSVEDVAYNQLCKRAEIERKIKDLEKRNKKKKENRKFPESKKLAWLWDNTNQLKGSLLITDRQLSMGKDRFGFYIDKNRKNTVHTGGKTCVASVQQSIEDLYVLAGLIATKFFIPWCRACNMSSRENGSIFLSPAELEKLLIPDLNKRQKIKIADIIKNGNKYGNSLSSTDILDIEDVFLKYLSIEKESETDRFDYNSISPLGYYFKQRIGSKVDEVAYLCTEIFLLLKESKKDTSTTNKSKQDILAFSKTLTDIQQKFTTQITANLFAEFEIAFDKKAITKLRSMHKRLLKNNQSVAA